MAELSGIIFVTLEGQENYRLWERSFKNAAMAAGVWEFFTGERTTFQMSTQDPCFGTYYGQRFINLDGKSYNCAAMQWDQALATYAQARYEVDRSCDLANSAMVLLRQSLTPDIADILPTYQDPKQAWAFIKDRYSTSMEVALKQALDRMSRISSTQFDKFNRYINAIVRAQFEIVDAGGDFSDDKVKAKIIDGLNLEQKLAVQASGVAFRAPKLSVREFTAEVLALI